jgi:ubiquinone/menaquinone biosynthesis C-methylase UbiE
MSNPSKPEKPSTYFVQDRSNQEELRRLQMQDHLLTAAMGGVLPEQPDPGRLRSVLDVGCGTGGWVIEGAQTIPTVTRWVGVDVSRTYVEYARVQAEAAGVSNRVQFHTMDALLRLELRDHTFDLVNQRLGMGWLRTWDWLKVLSEYQRVCRQDGVVRLTESDVVWKNTSPALTRLGELYVQAFHRAGSLFAPTHQGLRGELARLLHLHGFHDVQTQSCVIDYRAGTAEGESMLANAKLAYRTGLPFLRKWTKVPEDYEQLLQQIVSETQQPDFEASWSLLTAWGRWE